MVSAACVNCGRCNVDGCAVKNGESCSGCGKCVELCGNGFRKISGKTFTPKELAEKIMTYNPFFGEDGGVTFSGGEPTMQADFLCETLDLLPIHRAIQTCGFCSEAVFRRVLDRVDYLFFDIKHTDPEKHGLYTGVDNRQILQNLKILKASGKPFIARIPLISGVNDGEENLLATAKLLADANGLERVELLPYNGAAGAKYKMLGKEFPYSFHSPENIRADIFANFGIRVKVM